MTRSRTLSSGCKQRAWRESASAGSAPRLLGVLCVSAVMAFAQVAEKANAHYGTPEQRERLAQSLGSPDRDTRQKPQLLVKALALKAGMTAADIGSGPGYMLPFLSRAVGPAGKVIAQDIFPDFLQKARQKAEREGLKNVTAILGTESDPKLPENSIDVALSLDAYHHFNYPEKTLAGIRAALKPNGRLVIVDFYRSPTSMPGRNAMEHVRADKPAVIREIEGCGFRLVEDRDHVPASQYMLTFERK